MTATGAEDEAARLQSLFSAENLAGKAPRRRRLWLVLVLVGALAATSVGVLAVRLNAAPTNYPATWNSTVAPFAAVVEAERDQKFDHPVYVDFLDNKDFRAEAAKADALSSGQDHERIEQGVELLRTFGVVSGELDLFNDVNQLRGSGVFAYYSYGDQRIRVRGKDLTPAVQSALVVALARALQDQRFDVGTRLREVSRDPVQETALQALALGDATHVEASWFDSLTAREQKAIEEDRVRLGVKTGDGSSRVPGIVKALVGVPDEFGEALVDTVLVDGGQRQLDSRFQVPPTTSEQLLDPWALVEDHQGYLDISAPVLTEKETETGSGTFGAIYWLLLLAERLPPARALEAAQGWGSDRFVTYDRDQTSCVKVTYAADGPKDLSQMKSALGSWSRLGPDKKSLTVERQGRVLLVESCTPTAEVREPSADGPRQAVDLAVGRTQLSLALLRKDIDMEVATARCGAEFLLPGPDVPAEMTSPATNSLVRRVLKACINPSTGHTN